MDGVVVSVKGVWKNSEFYATVNRAQHQICRQDVKIGKPFERKRLRRTRKDPLDSNFLLFIPLSFSVHAVSALAYK